MNRYYFKLLTLLTSAIIAWGATSCEKVTVPKAEAGALQFDGIKTVDISDSGLVTLTWDAATMTDATGALLPVTYTVYVSEADSTSLTADDEANQPKKLKLQVSEMPRNAGKKVAAVTSTSYSLKDDLVAEKKWAVEVVASAGASSLSNDTAYGFLYMPGASNAYAEKIEAYLGNFQSGGLNLPASGAFTARVMKGAKPKPGETVTFAITQTPTGATGQSISKTSASSDQSGQASTNFTAGDKNGAYLVTATWKTYQATFVFYATSAGDIQNELNNLTNSDRLEAYQGNFQSGSVSAAAASAFTARALRGIAPKSGESVTFAITQAPPGATGQAISAAAGTTDAYGLVTTRFTAGNKDGAYIVTATWNTSTANFVYYASSAAAIQDSVSELANAEKIESYLGNFQSGAVSATAAAPFKARTLAGATPQAGETVTFAITQIPSGALGQSISVSSATTDANGIASTSFTAGDKDGAYIVTATWKTHQTAFVYYATSVDQIQNQLSTLSNVEKIETYQGNFQSGAVSAAAAGGFTARTIRGTTPKAGETVSFAITQVPPGATGQSISSSTGTTDASGLVSTTFTAGNKDGAYIVTATWKTFTADFVYYASSVADVQGLVAALANADKLEAYIGNFQSGAVGMAAPGPLKARALKGSTPQAGETVTFAITQTPAGATGQAISISSGTTDATGVLSTNFTAGDKDGAYMITATWKTNSATFVYYANLTNDLQNQINTLANPTYGNGSGVTPPLAIAVGVPAQTTSTTSYTFGVQDVAEYKYVIVSASVTCAEAVNGFSANWTPISTPITVSGLSQGEKRLCLIGKNGAYVQQTATSYTWIINSAAPSTFAIIAPSVTTNSITPIVQWQPSIGAATYNLKVSTDAGCSSIIQSYPSLTTTSQTLLALANGTYYVCVRAISAAGTFSDASNTGYGFLVDSSAPNTPAAPTTAASYIASSTITFNWVGVTDVGPSGITGYNFRVGTSAGASDTFSEFVGMVNSKSIPGLNDGGVYYAQVQAVDAAGNTSSWSPASIATRVDISLTSAPTTIITAASAATGPDVRYASTGSFFVAWSGASDSGSGLLNYTLVKYSQANCAGTSTTTTGITGTNNNVTGGIDGTTYSFKVVAYDNVGNFATSACSGNISVFSAATVALTSFTGATGNLSGEINLTWVYPANTSRYASIAIRRISGATAPADCSSGTLATTITNFSSTTVIDQTLGAGSYFSYRACVTDLAGNVTSTNTAVNIQAKVFSHIIFTTRNNYNGNFGGYFGADAACTTSAAAAGLTADHWKAVISWSYNDASSRLGILGPIYRTNGTSIATSGADLWDGAISAAINYDEFGTVAANVPTWTSTTSSGVNGGHHCAEWTSTLWTGLSGGSQATSGSWVWYGANLSCVNSYKLYCMSQVGPGFKAVTGTGASGDVALTLTFPATTSSYGKVTIRRTTGYTAPSSNCTTTGTEIANITNFTTQTITDATGTSAGFFSYRACLYDTANNLVTSTPLSNIQSKGLSHKAFVTSTTYNGNLGGLNGADDKCAAAAAAGGLTADHWRAIISTSYNNISQRINITGPVYRTDGLIIATGSADFWDGTLVYNIGTYENGVPYTGTNQVWTSSTTAGFDNGNSCGNFTYANGNTMNYPGLANYGDGNWPSSYVVGTCADSRRLYCISQAGPRFKADTGTVTSGDIVYSLTFPADTSTYGSVKIRRIAGTTAPNADCASDGTQVANITTFSSGNWTDATGAPSSLFSYRACLYNTSNTLIQTYPVSAVRAMGTVHTIFTTNAVHNGNFGGMSGMDAFCSSAASTAGLSGDHYRAVASGWEISAKDRLDIRGPIIRRDGYVVATNAADLWDGTISVTLNVDENAAYTTGTVGVWTGTNQAGLSWGECGGFKTTAYTLYQNRGNTDNTGAAWVQYYPTNGDSCASSFHVYCISQIGPRFSAATGTGSIGDITMTLNFPTTTSHMSNVTIRRILGDTPPNADCTSDGTQVANITNLTSQTLTDATGVNSGIYSYRACTYGPGNVLIGTFPFAQVRAKGLSHTMFVTSGTFNGSLGGLSGADSLCSNAANVAGILGDGWKAVMSDGTADAKDRLVIKGPIYRGDGSLIARSAADLWDSVIGAAVNITETGAWYTGTQYVWTGTSATGVNNGQNCGNWLSSSATAGVYTGRADWGNSAWTENNTNTSCSTPYRLYCLNKVGTAAPLTNFTAATGTVTNGDITLTMTYPATTSDWARLDIRRLEGKYSPSADCASTGSTVTSITNFATTSYTDNAPSPGRIYSYRACAYGTDGFLIGSLITTSTKAKGGSHKIFMTTASYTGNLGGLAGADAKCAAAATAGGQTGTFVALLSTTSVNARDRYTGASDPIYNTNNDLIAVNQSDLWDGTLLASTNYDEYSNPGPSVGSVSIWSQSLAGGTYGLSSNGNNCSDWTNGTSSASLSGLNGKTDSTWIYATTYAWCNQGNRLHCISQ